MVPNWARFVADFAGTVTRRHLRFKWPEQQAHGERSMSEPDSADAEPALLNLDGAIATITLNRPNAFNAINLSIARKLEQLSADVEASNSIKVLVLQGEGRA